MVLYTTEREAARVILTSFTHHCHHYCNTHISSELKKLLIAMHTTETCCNKTLKPSLPVHFALILPSSPLFLPALHT
jgi:hypothetical protein